MSQQPHRDGGRWAAHEDIQPASEDSEDDHQTSYEDRLVAAEKEPDDDRLDRMLGDADLLLGLQLNSYAPKVWNPVAEEFARYGLAVFRSWIRLGFVFGIVTKATGYGFTKLPDERITDPVEVEDLASMTVVYALADFLEKVLKQNKWDPNRGASLKTYFIGQCKWQFPNVYKEWSRLQRRTPAGESLDYLIDKNVLAPAHDNIAATFDRDAEIQEVLSAVDSAEAQSALVYQAEGYSHAEIALMTGLKDAKAVENLIGRWKRRLASERKSA
jgi:DNA-directed RNA polymerase specialized sigma24 family protein